LPPLRQRKEDILPLAEFFLKKFAALNGKKVEGFNKSALEFLLKNSWTGNVRELENSIERAVVLCDAPTLSASDLVLEDFGLIEAASDQNLASADSYSATAISEYTQASSSPAAAPDEFFGLLKTENEPLVSLDELTSRYLMYALERNNGAKDKTARDLGIDRKTLYRRLQEISRPQPSAISRESAPAGASFTQ